MTGLHMTVFDIAFLIILLLSAVVAFARGFVSEVLSLFAWGGAVFATLYGLPLFKPFARAHIKPDLLADILLIFILAVVSLVILKLTAGYIGDRVKQSQIGSLDRLLGALFGLLRGFLVVCVAYMVMSWIIPRHKQPDWVALARFRPLVEYGSGFLRHLLPQDMARHMEPFGGNQDMKSILKEMKSGTAPTADDKTEGIGYGKADRDGMDRLIEHH